jgi:hypothetical protein
LSTITLTQTQAMIVKPKHKKAEARNKIQLTTYNS